MVGCANGIVPKLQHNKPPLPNVWLVNPTTNNTQSEVDALGQIRFALVQGAPLVTLITKFNDLQILLGVVPNIQNGCKLCVKQCLPTNMFRMKDVTTLDAKVVNINFTPQGHIYIYELLVHESIVNNLSCTYFVIIGVYPNFICLDLVSNVVSFGHSYFLSFKHMYYIYNVHLNLVETLEHTNHH
jgi:hypothetical protein